VVNEYASRRTLRALGDPPSDPTKSLAHLIATRVPSYSWPRYMSPNPPPHMGISLHFDRSSKGVISGQPCSTRFAMTSATGYMKIKSCRTVIGTNRYHSVTNNGRSCAIEL
jgi:hypothetical protein